MLVPHVPNGTLSDKSSTLSTILACPAASLQDRPISARSFFVLFHQDLNGLHPSLCPTIQLHNKTDFIYCIITSRI